MRLARCLNPRLDSALPCERLPANAEMTSQRTVVEALCQGPVHLAVDTLADYIPAENFLRRQPVCETNCPQCSTGSG